ncbi:MAG: hypothetical protein FJW37_11695, partial [Acidobacteria bacterium]|nr:hypothetical protein [Acidobacteriota bacterium]
MRACAFCTGLRFQATDLVWNGKVQAAGAARGSLPGSHRERCCAPGLHCTRLLIFDDRIEFHSPGRAPNTVDEEAMRAGVNVVRNPHIYARLSDAGLVTRAGRG